jgi:hypothetical protein
VSKLDNSDKEAAQQFLDRLRVLLEGKITSDTRKDIRAIAASTDKHTNTPEAAFLHKYVVPELSRLLQDNGLTESQACTALLCEGYKHIRAVASGTPMHPLPHPFDKVIAPATEILRKWQGKTPQMTQACPDIAVRDPFRSKIVFEVKYFEKGKSDFAARELVKYIYQAFFYRALPYVPQTPRHSSWGFDFSCLIACDATVDGTLKTAWDNLSDQARNGFWSGANVYVMILRGSSP